MKRFIIILFLYLLHFSKNSAIPEKDQSRIMNGQNAPEGKFPYQAFVKGERSGCGASVIHSRWLLTAGHCVSMSTRIKKMQVTVGTTDISGIGGSICGVENITVHENYRLDWYKVQNDIALIRLNCELKFNGDVNYIELSNDDQRRYEGKDALITGWGLLDFSRKRSKHLQYISVRVIEQRQCHRDWQYLTDQQICTSISGQKSACNGDSGGPVVAENVQIGIVSYADSTCGYRLPNVHTRVSSYVPWIEKQLKRHGDELPK